MSVPSRSPEGLPSCCPLCGNAASSEFSQNDGDAPCAGCDQLLDWFENRMAEKWNIRPGDSTSYAERLQRELLTDSLDTVETVLSVEEEFDVIIHEDALWEIRTVGDAIRFIQTQRSRKALRNDESA